MAAARSLVEAAWFPLANEVSMDAVLIAGGVPEVSDPLFATTQGAPKAMLEIAGKAMAQWVLDALQGASSVGRVVIVGLPADCGLQSEKIRVFVPDQGGLLPNVKAGMHAARSLDQAASHVLIVASDVPAVTPEMINWRVGIAMESDSDLDYVVVERQVMENRFPESNRSYVRLKDVEVCGGDINVIRLDLAADDDLWSRILAARKSPLRQAALVGFDTLLLTLARRQDLEQAASRVSRRLHLVGKAHLAPYAELAMDVDKPHQLEILRRHLAQRQAN
jgi:GTP:adenosylcobinamide-phosphate guanylyltransferase